MLMIDERRNAVSRAKLDVAEKVLLGITPKQTLDIPSPQSAVLPHALSARLETVRTYLNGNPAIRDAFLKEVKEKWASTAGHEGEFEAAIAERRDAINSLASMDEFQKQAPQSVSRLREELDRYMQVIEGAGSSTRW
jgi:hypothetical protein